MAPVPVLDYFDMNQFLKTLLLWLLILALPAQGYAAALSSSCGPTHRHAMRTVVAQLFSHTMHKHKHDHHRHHHAAHTHDAEVAEVGSSDTSPPLAGHGAAKCSACADCCFGAAAAMLPYVQTWMPFDQRVAISISPPTLPFSGHIPAALERPPRTFLA